MPKQYNVCRHTKPPFHIHIEYIKKYYKKYIRVLHYCIAKEFTTRSYTHPYYGSEINRGFIAIRNTYRIKRKDLKCICKDRRLYKALIRFICMRVLPKTVRGDVEYTGCVTQRIKDLRMLLKCFITKGVKI